MDSRKTPEGDGDERTTENVVRLPRDWLGPRDELVPIGSRACARETTDGAPSESLPPHRRLLLGRGLGFSPGPHASAARSVARSMGPRFR